MILDIIGIVLNVVCGYVCEVEGRYNTYFGTAVRYYDVLLEFEARVMLLQEIRMCWIYLQGQMITINVVFANKNSLDL